MTDLKDLLSERADRSTPVGSEKLRQRVALTLASAGRRYLAGADRHRLAGLQVAFAAAAVVIAVMAVAVLLDPFGSEAPFVDEPTTGPVSTTTATETTVAPITTTTAASAVEHPTISWVRVESDAFGGEGDVFIDAVVEGGPGLVAVGAVDFGEDVFQAAVWYSTDGTTWSRVPHDEAVFGDALIRAVVAGGPGLVAVGNAGNFAEDSAAAVWVSENGINWSRVPHDEEVFGGGTNPDMWDVAVGGPGLVAVGWDNVYLDHRAAVWTSSDGLTWDRAPHDETTFGGRGVQGMWALTSGDSGLVGVGPGAGWAGAGGPGQPAAVWTSPDGLTWTRAPEQEQLESGHPTGDRPGRDGDWALMNDITEVEEGFVAVGRVGWCTIPCDETASAWTSVDGRVWQRSQVEHAGGVQSADMQSVTPLGDVLVGVGRGVSGAGSGPAVVWTSIDGGQTWARQPHSGTMFGKLNEGPVAMWAVTAYDSRLVAAGNWGSDAAVWIGTIEE